MATAAEILEKAKREAAARAGKTTEERLAEMKAEREKKLAEQAAAREETKKSTPSKQEQADLERNKKFAAERLAENPDTGAGGIVGSTITKWAIDPKTGKQRTPQEIIKAVTDAVLADKSSGGISLDPLTGKQRALTPAEKVNQALAQLMQNARYEGEGYEPAYRVFEYLKKGSRGGAVNALSGNPELWSLGKENVGKVLDRKYFDEPSSRKVFIVDPTRNQLTPEQIKSIKESGAMALDPVTGFEVMIDSQGRYTLGDQPNDANIEDYSKYTPSFEELNYRLGNMGGGTGGGTTIDPVTGLPVYTGGGTGGSTGGGSNLSLNPNDPKYAEGRSAYNLLYTEFKKYGLESLVEPLKGLITSGIPKEEYILKLRDSEPYKKRFAGNAARLAKGLAAISEAEYIGLEDQYQGIMRNYGLPDTYWKKDAMGTQEGFTNFIGNDVSAAELEDRIMNAQKRVINSNPEVSTALKQFYPEITNGDILAYTLDPTKGLDVIKRKITAAEIGGAALAQGLGTSMTRAEELAKYGVTKEQAQKGYQTAAEIVPRGGQLAAIYGESPYDQTTAEQEIFGLAGSAEASKKRKKLAGLEQAAFSGQAGTTQGALGRERAGAI